MLKALETLPLRIERQARSAGQVADWLAGQGQLTRLIFPGRADHPQAAIVARQMSGPSTLIAFEVAGGKEAAFRLLNAVKLIRISNNLGDAKSLIVHPATTTHQRFAAEIRAAMGVTEGMIRLSIGLEHPDDLIADLAQALAAI